MRKIVVGDYVVFNYRGRDMTGLVKEIISNKESESYRIVPSAIGIDFFPVVESKHVTKISSK